MGSARKAIALISGGLDSMLAARVLIDQGIHVEGINFYTGFCHSGHTAVIRGRPAKRNDALWVAEQLGIKLHIMDIAEEYRQVLTQPKYGYGKNLNPCLDCKIFMLQKARAWMLEQQFDFVITGEVLGQRPKSQRRDTLLIVERESGLGDRLLRPLSAKHFDISLPEREGWVDRDQLLDFNGRNRKPQLALAKQFGFEDYAQPAGGCCVLTDESYSRRLSDLWESRGNKNYTMDDIILLKVGRQLRPRPHFKVIIGRDEGENNFLQGYRKQFTHIEVLSHSGPLALIDGVVNQEEEHFAARIVARFSAGRGADRVELAVREGRDEGYRVWLQPWPEKDIESSWYV